MRKVALVVGHRKKSQGAWGNAGWSEYRFNSKLAKKIKKTLSSDDIAVKIFYRDDEWGGYGEKMKRLHKRIDEWGSDYSISMHFNAASSVMVAGHEVLYCSKRGKKAAEILNREFAKALGSADRGIKRRGRGDRGGGFLCRGRSACILAEPFFAAHQDRYMPGTDGWEALAGAYVSAIEKIVESGV